MSQKFQYRCAVTMSHYSAKASFGNFNNFNRWKMLSFFLRRHSKRILRVTLHSLDQWQKASVLLAKIFSFWLTEVVEGVTEGYFGRQIINRVVYQPWTLQAPKTPGFLSSNGNLINYEFVGEYASLKHKINWHDESLKVVGFQDMGQKIQALSSVLPVGLLVN